MGFSERIQHKNSAKGMIATALNFIRNGQCDAAPIVADASAESRAFGLLDRQVRLKEKSINTNGALD